MSNVNLKTFPQLGAFPNEVGSSNSIGGINNSAMWPMNLPLNYWFNYGFKRSSRSKTKKHKFSSKKRKIRRSRK